MLGRYGSFFTGADKNDTFFFCFFFHFSCQPRKLADWQIISNTASVVIIILIKKNYQQKILVNTNMKSCKTVAGESKKNRLDAKVTLL